MVHLLLAIPVMVVVDTGLAVSVDMEDQKAKEEVETTTKVDAEQKVKEETGTKVKADAE